MNKCKSDTNLPEFYIYTFSLKCTRPTGFEPRTFRSKVKSDNHYTSVAGLLNNLFLFIDMMLSEVNPSLSHSLWLICICPIGSWNYWQSQCRNLTLFTYPFQNIRPPTSTGDPGSIPGPATSRLTQAFHPSNWWAAYKLAPSNEAVMVQYPCRYKVRTSSRLYHTSNRPLYTWIAPWGAEKVLGP